MKNKCIKINSNDNVAVAVESLKKGEIVYIDKEEILVSDNIESGHKIALRDFDKGSIIIKYGSPIGHTINNINKGCLVNEKNIKTNLSGLESYKYSGAKIVESECEDDKKYFFDGYPRSNGDVGIRNEIWIIPTVGCVNGTALRLAEILKSETGETGVDAIVAFTHNYGCSQLGEDHENTKKIIRNMALHPNVGAVLIVGLGCENNQISAFKPLLGNYDENRIRFIETQKEDDEIETGMEILRSLYTLVVNDKREKQPISKLKIGLKCGGSDGFSGITANPLLGAFSDFLISQGGTTVLTEVPEMFGAETLLMERCINKEVFEKTVTLINDFKQYFIDNNQPVYENPSPGNKAGGISTLEEKSLGCTQKSGSSSVIDVLNYGDILKNNG